MATRYWVGGSGTWDNSSTTNWSTTNGGAPGASAPTSADDVIINCPASSTVVVTVAANVSCANLTGTLGSGTALTITRSVGTETVSVYGSLALSSVTASVEIIMAATSTGKTISANYPISTFRLNGAGGGWTLLQALQVSFSFYVTQGSFDTASYALQMRRFYSIGTATRSITLNSSTVTMTGGIPVQLEFASTGLTFNAGTSTFAVNEIFATFTSGGQTFNNITLLGTSTGNQLRFYDAAVCNQILFSSNNGDNQLYLFGNLTVNSINFGSNTTLLSYFASGNGTPYTVTSATKTPVTYNNMVIIDIMASPINTWYATNSVGSGTTTGWSFGRPSVGFMALLR